MPREFDPNEVEDAEDLPLETTAETDETSGEPGQDDGDPSTPAEIAAARAQGWVPEEEWDDARAERQGRRKPARFLTAREFLNQNENSLPFLRSQLRKLTDKQVESEAKLNDMHQILLDQKRMSQDATRRAYERGRAEAEAEMRQAVEEGDVAKFDQAQAKLKAYDEAPARPEPATPPAAAPRPATDPEIDRWVKQNAWFLSNETLHHAMKAAHTLTLQQNPGASQWDSLEDAKAVVMQQYPQFFNRQRPTKGAAQVSTPTGNRPSRPTVSAKLSQLPKEDQEAFRRQQAMFKAKGYDFTEDEFLKEYNGG